MFSFRRAAFQDFVPGAPPFFFWARDSFCPFLFPTHNCGNNV